LDAQQPQLLGLVLFDGFPWERLLQLDILLDPRRRAFLQSNSSAMLGRSNKSSNVIFSNVVKIVLKTCVRLQHG